MSYRPYAAIIAEATSAATGMRVELQNDSGSAIASLQPVCSDSDGKIQAIDVSIEDDAIKTLGVSTTSISDGSSGLILTHGRLEAVTTPYSFGDYVYVSKTGDLTNILPSEGVGGFISGDYIIRIGTIVRNKSIPSQKDLLVNVTVVGQV